MTEIWPWICELTNSEEPAESDSPLVLDLTSSKQSHEHSAHSIQLIAERTWGSNNDSFISFSVCLNGFNSVGDSKLLWVSEKCPLSSEKPFLPLLLELLRGIISRSPISQDSTCPRSQLQKLKPDPISWLMDSHSPESFSSFFNLVFLTRLFWLCVCEAPSEVGSFYFQHLLSPHLDVFSSKLAPVLRAFLITVGVDAELCFVRAVGYMMAKWLILREVGVGLKSLAPSSSQNLGFSYAYEAHGLWVLKGYTPVLSMRLAGSGGRKPHQFPLIEPKETALRYALAHQQLEAVIQMEYSVAFNDGFIQVNARVDNLRFHVVRLGFRGEDGANCGEERQFVSRVRVWVGPEVGAAYVSGVSLGRSTGSREREVKIQRVWRGSFGKSKFPMVKTSARTSAKAKVKSWRMDQVAEGNAAIFDAVFCDDVSRDVDRQKQHVGDGRALAFNKGAVFARDEYGEQVGWRVGKEMEGSVLKWRIGGQVWLKHWGSPFVETRRVEWCDEVDLPLIPSK